MPAPTVPAKHGRAALETVPVIKVKNVRVGVIDRSDLLLTAPEIDAQYARARVRPSDVLLTIRGTTGRHARVPAELANANITQDTARLSLRKGVNAGYIFHVLHSSDSQAQIRDHTRGQAEKGINIGDVRKLKLPLPRLDEQAAIAEILEALDRTTAFTRAERDALRQMKEGLMSSSSPGNSASAPTRNSRNAHHLPRALPVLLLLRERGLRAQARSRGGRRIVSLNSGWSRSLR